MTTAQTAIVVTGAVGLGTPAIGHAFELLREKRRREAALADKKADDMRSLLDKLTGTMYQHTMTLTALESWRSDRLTSQGGERGPAPNISPSRKELYTLNASLTIRRGRDDDLVTALGEYLKPTDEATAEIMVLWDSNEPFDYDDAALEARASLYWQKYEDFVDAAQASLDRAERI